MPWTSTTRGRLAGWETSRSGIHPPLENRPVHAAAVDQALGDLFDLDRDFLAVDHRDPADGDVHPAVELRGRAGEVAHAQQLQQGGFLQRPQADVKREAEHAVELGLAERLAEVAADAIEIRGKRAHVGEQQRLGLVFGDELEGVEFLRADQVAVADGPLARLVAVAPQAQALTALEVFEKGWGCAHGGRMPRARGWDGLKGFRGQSEDMAIIEFWI